MSDILKDMARILAIGQLASPEAAKEMIGNTTKKSIIENTVIATKRLSDAQKKELQKQEDASSSTTNTTSTTSTTEATNTTGITDNKQDTSKAVQIPQPEINDTVEISPKALKALESEATNQPPSQSNITNSAP